MLAAVCAACDAALSPDRKWYQMNGLPSAEAWLRQAW